jgi:hypothetical protein
MVFAVEQWLLQIGPLGFSFFFIQLKYCGTYHLL